MIPINWMETLIKKKKNRKQLLNSDKYKVITKPSQIGNSSNLYNGFLQILAHLQAPLFEPLSARLRSTFPLHHHPPLHSIQRWLSRFHSKCRTKWRYGNTHEESRKNVQWSEGKDEVHWSWLFITNFSICHYLIIFSVLSF